MIFQMELEFFLRSQIKSIITDFPITEKEWNLPVKDDQAPGGVVLARRLQSK